VGSSVDAGNPSLKSAIFSPSLSLIITPTTRKTAHQDLQSEEEEAMFAFKETVSEFGKNVGTKIKISKRPKPDAKSLAGQVIVVTGANRGMGKIVAEDCAARGARVVMGCRDLAAAAKAIDDIRFVLTLSLIIASNLIHDSFDCHRTRNPSADLVACQLDLAVFASVHAFAGAVQQNEKKVDVLVNNAAIIASERSVTVDGHEMSIQVNYYSPVMLTLLLAPFLEKTSDDPRIVTVGALGHSYVKDIHWQDLSSLPVSSSPFHVYLHSKLALMLFVRELAVRKSANRGARVYCVDPGVAPTDLANGGPKPNSGILSKVTSSILTGIGRTVQQSADSIVKVIIMDREGYDPRNYYFMDGLPKSLSKVAQDDARALRLWDMTSEVIPIMKSLPPNKPESESAGK
jgi:NAD(P)-dependent dehydrogenase (short-subunit alcohol dehydrogenase family)